MAHALAHVLNQERLYIRIWLEDGVYIAKCLDIPGCVSEGGSRDEALSNLRDAIALCLNVIREDRAVHTSSTAPEAEIIECPMTLDQHRLESLCHSE